MDIPWFTDADIHTFPPITEALSKPDGLLAAGGNLSPISLINAYQSGIFPWFDKEQPILWWSPSTRAVIPTNGIHISKNMAKLCRSKRYQLRSDTVFAKVINACSERKATWITNDMRAAYKQLHDQGIAHSIEVFDTDGTLVGGLYGVFVKNIFCGESMFSFSPNTSKFALIGLAKFLHAHGCQTIDCQIPTEHLLSMGAQEIQKTDFVTNLAHMQDNNFLLNSIWTDLWQASSI